jgi:hypothetical protein
MIYLSEWTKWKQMVSAGRLTDKSLRRLRKAKLIKPEKEYNKGLAKGTRELLKQAGAEEKTSKDLANRISKELEIPNSKNNKVVNWINKKNKKRIDKSIDKQPTLVKYLTTDRTTSHPTTIYTPGKKKAKGVGHQIARRHEADEAIQSNNPYRTRVNTRGKGILARFKRGAHHDPSVLARERKETDFAKHAYKGKGTGRAAENLQQTRKKAKIDGMDVDEHTFSGSRNLQRKFRKNRRKAMERKLERYLSKNIGT